MPTIGVAELLAVAALVGIGVSIDRRRDPGFDELVDRNLAAIALSILAFASLVIFQPNAKSDSALKVFALVYFVPLEVSGLVLVATFLDYVLSLEGFARS